MTWCAVAAMIAVAGCGDSSAEPESTETPVAAAATTTTPPAATTTTTAAAATTTTLAATTTTEATTTTTEGPDCPTLQITEGRGDLYDPGCFKALWFGAPFVITLEEATLVFVGEYFDEFVFAPEPGSGAEFNLTEFSYLFSHSEGTVKEISVPRDPTAFFEAHPYLDASEPEAVDVSGRAGLQFDVVVTGSPDDVGFFHLGGYDEHPSFAPWDVGEAIRVTFVVVDAHPIWMFTLSGVPDGGSAEEAASFHDSLVGGIEFS